MKLNKTNLVLATLALNATAAMANPAGLKPVTLSELKHMEKNHGMKRIKKIKLNKTGLERVNQERVRRGMDSLPSTSATTGQDTLADADATVGSSTPYSSSDPMVGYLPTAIDNSTLPAFPPIGHQYWNSCAGWAMGYYQLSHNYNQAMGYSAKADVSKRCSPKFVYTMINSGVDNGAYFSDALNMVGKHGCVTWDKFPEDGDYRGWNLNPDHWQSAISMRANAFQYVGSLDTATGLDQLKQLLNNGYVLTFGTYINSWQYTTIKANPNAASNPLAGQKVAHWMNGQNGGHAMTIVGYDDNAWTDINANNVVDAGELGVLKIANSWGTTWGNAGYMFISYDAIKTTSAVAGGPSAGRVGMFMNRQAYHQPVKASNGVDYIPKYLAKYTVKHGLRNQMSLNFGSSTTAYNAPTNNYVPFALMNKGGAYAFNGTATAVDGTFVTDISELPISSTGDTKLYLAMNDNTAGTAGTISSFQVIDVVKSTQSAANLMSPLVADGNTTIAALTHSSSVANQAPVASFTATTASGVAPLYTTMDASSSYDPDGSIYSYSWAFGDGTAASGVSVSKTYNSAGTYTATLTVTDDQGVTNSTSKAISVSAPVSTADTTAPSVTLTSPANGARYARYATVSASATATDNVKVTRVRFYVNGYRKCTDYTAPFTCNFSMPSGTNVSVKATANDAAGNTRTSNINYISN